MMTPAPTPVPEDASFLPPPQLPSIIASAWLESRELVGLTRRTLTLFLARG
jgi:hypothetical protein